MRGIVRTYAMQAAAGREDKTVELIGRVLGVEVGERCLVSRFPLFLEELRGSFSAVSR